MIDRDTSYINILCWSQRAFEVASSFPTDISGCLLKNAHFYSFDEFFFSMSFKTLFFATQDFKNRKFITSFFFRKF